MTDLEVPNGGKNDTAKDLTTKKSNAAERIQQATHAAETANKAGKLEELHDEEDPAVNDITTGKTKKKTKNEGGEEDKEGEDDESSTGFCAKQSLKSRIIQGVAAASVLLNLIAIAVEFSYITMVAGAFAILIAPVVVVLQLKLQDMSTMTAIQNQLRKDVNQLQDENNKLVAEVNVLEEEVAELQVQEKKLKDITSAQGTNVTSFVALVKENRELVEKQGKAVRHSTAQMLSSVVINSDGNCDGSFSEQELRKLQVKLHALPGIRVNDGALRESLRKSGGDMGALLKLANGITQKPAAASSKNNKQETILEEDDEEAVFSVVPPEELVSDGDANHESDSGKDEKKVEDE